MISDDLGSKNSFLCKDLFEMNQSAKQWLQAHWERIQWHALDVEDFVTIACSHKEPQCQVYLTN